MTIELWKDISGFENLYMVSNFGRVKSLDRLVNCSRGTKSRLWRGKILKLSLGCRRKHIEGYLQCSLSSKGKTYKVYVHKLVAETFLLERNETVNHIDGNKLNNYLSNLEWISFSENIKHAFSLGLKVPLKGKRCLK